MIPLHKRFLLQRFLFSSHLILILFLNDVAVSNDNDEPRDIGIYASNRDNDTT